MTAVLEPPELDDVEVALVGMGAQGMTVSGAQGSGRRRGRTEVHRGAGHTVASVPKTPVEDVVRVRTGERGAEAL